jgi:hypothetical protein
MPRPICADPPHFWEIDEKNIGVCRKCGAPHPRRKENGSPWLHPGVDKVVARQKKSHPWILPVPPPS